MENELVSLAVSVLKWWEIHRYDVVNTEDGEINLYDWSPDFVDYAYNIIRKYAPEKEVEIFGTKED